ncbi:MAG: amino acid permease [Gammaproteobacteria bacterium]|jgi:basic amino acid/polyamine antiporter, APA family|nr:amino acid permease [Gammaproteobacteria bacterium]MBT7370567.1 amino acid permease [Gammaproteobacteria bacterium]
MSSPKFAKSIGRKEVVALSFGAMIGWSWVLLTGDWLTRAGFLGTAIAFVIGGIAVILISLTYAELAAAMPKVGGEHVYTYRALGFTASFITSWAIVMAYVNVCVFESAALPTALEYLFPELRQGYLYTVEGSDVYASMVAIGIGGAVVMTFINYIGIRFAAFVQTLVTGLFVIVGVLFLAGALGFESQVEAGPLMKNGVTGMLTVLIMVPALMVGFDVIPQSAEEINLPRDQIGKMIVLSVCMAVLWYIAITFAVGLSLSGEELAMASVATADAMSKTWGSEQAGALMIVAGIGGILTSWNAFIIGGSRVLYALSESRMIPEIFSRVHPRYQTPHVCVLFIGVLSCISPFFGRTVLVWLVDAGSFMIVVAYGFVAWAFIRLRKTEPAMERPFRVRFGTLVGYLALIMSVLLGMLYLPFSPSALIWPYEWLVVLIGGLVGFAFYIWAVRRR